ncbi:MAG: glycosyltransferase family 4 protein [Actinomycetaceae bacterium]|nr:glycosyltransferase family 4 protein [Actinomycetaceae bacterium]MDY6083271.1 glycosyltransferase family 4 protein [Actinomycetaceae bacterium]
MKIGIACPYSWDVAGGVQFHIRDLAQALIARGHSVSVIAPAQDTEHLPSFVVSTGAAVPIRYNGSVARLAFGPHVNNRVKEWLADGAFDVLHVHEPLVPSVSMVALRNAQCPVVATFHSAMDSSRALTLAAPFLLPFLDKIQARIAVSQEARRTAVQYLGSDAYVIPNGVYTQDFAHASSDPRYQGTAEAPTVGFLGRIDEPRKGLAVLAQAWQKVVKEIPGAHLFVAGKGDSDAARVLFSDAASSVEFLGAISDEEKQRFFSSIDVYVAPNTGGESFGIILVEAMSAGAFLVGSNIPAFRAVLGDGSFGDQFMNGDPQDLARVLVQALRDPARRHDVTSRAAREAQHYDWGTVASQVFAVYETAIHIAGAELEREG